MPDQFGTESPEEKKAFDDKEATDAFLQRWYDWIEDQARILSDSVGKSPKKADTFGANDEISGND